MHYVVVWIQRLRREKFDSIDDVFAFCFRVEVIG